MLMFSTSPHVIRQKFKIFSSRTIFVILISKKVIGLCRKSYEKENHKINKHCNKKVHYIT